MTRYVMLWIIIKYGTLVISDILKIDQDNIIFLFVNDSWKMKILK